jgi:ubiquitin-protein ligase
MIPIAFPSQSATLDRIVFDQLIQTELAACHRHCNKGIVIQPSLRSLTTWQVYLMPSAGPFRSAILAFAIYFKNYPNAVPQIDFQTGVFHPLINYSSSSDTNFDAQALFPEWSAQTRVYSLFNAIYEAFVNPPTPARCANPDAAKLLKQDKEQYGRRAREALPAFDPATVEQRELNSPKKWTAQRESLVAVLAARGRLP